MTFEWYDPNKDVLRVSITQNGITFYKEVIEAMGSPEYILLGFNEDKKMIGVKICDKDHDNKIEFEAKRNNSYIRICDKKFIRFISSRANLNLDKKSRSRIYTALWDHELKILYIDLEKSSAF